MTKYKTSCKNCVFAHYNGSIQTYCELGRISRFQKQGGTELIQDNGKDGAVYHMINRFCNACRHTESDWAKSNNPQKYVEQIRKDIKIKLSIIAYFDNGNLNDLLNFLHYLSLQKLAPYEIYIINNQKNIKASVLFDQLNSLSLPFDWHITTVLQKEENLENCLKYVLHKINGKYFSIFKLPVSGIADNFILNIDIALNDRLEKFTYIEGINGQGDTYLTLVARILGGNEEKIMGYIKEEGEEETEIIIKNLNDKIYFLSKNNNEEYIIKNIKEICLDFEDKYVSA